MTIKTKHGTRIDEILGPIYFENTREFSGLLRCINEHGYEVQIRLDALIATSEEDEKMLEKYRRMIKGNNPKKEERLNKQSRNPDETWPGDMAELPEEKEEIILIEEPFFPEEEELPEGEDEADDFNKEKEGQTGETMEEVQGTLFEGDKIYNVLHTALTDVNTELKKVDKQIDNKKTEKTILLKKKEELQEAIKIYEEQRSDSE